MAWVFADPQLMMVGDRDDDGVDGDRDIDDIDGSDRVGCDRSDRDDGARDNRH